MREDKQEFLKSATKCMQIRYFQYSSGDQNLFSKYEGLSNNAGTAGTIQSTFRNFSSDAIYYFWEGQNQITSVGLPDAVKSIIIDKTAGSNLVLSKNTSISIHYNHRWNFRPSNFTINVLHLTGNLRCLAGNLLSGHLSRQIILLGI